MDQDLGKAHHNRKIAAKQSRHAKAFASRFTPEHKQRHDTKDAGPFHGIAGWPIVAWNTATPVNTNPVAPQVKSIAQALRPLITGSPDIFSYAVNPALIGDVPTTAFTQGAVNGQAPWNNFLNNNVQPFNFVAPEALGLHWGTWGQAGDSTGLISALTEGVELQLLEQQNTKFYQPGFSAPPGIRFDRRASSTVSNSYNVTEGFGGLQPNSLFELPDTMLWDPTKNYHLVLTATAQLKAWLALLTGPTAVTTETTGYLAATNLVPQQGTYILSLVYGSVLAPMISGV